MKKRNLCVAMLHSGGPAPGGNRVIGAAAKQFLDQGIRVILFRRGYEFLQATAADQLIAGTHYIEVTPEIASNMIEIDSTICKTSRANPGEKVKKPADLEDAAKTQALTHILDVFEALRVGALVSIGGDDTLRTANFLQELTIPRAKIHPDNHFMGVVHVPKTIDNDYFGISWTFGFFSAAEAAGKRLLGLYNDACTTSSYFVAELMGRKAGWYTIAASIFGRASFTLIPEDFEDVQVIDLRKLAEEIIDEIVLPRERQGKDYGVISIAEGLAEKLPPEIVQALRTDRFGHPKFSDARIGDRLASELEQVYRERTGKEKAFKGGNQIGYETRQVKPSLYDALLTSQLGVGAYRLIAERRLGHMVTIRSNLRIAQIAFAHLVDSATLKVKNRNVDRNGDFYALLRALEAYQPY
ncbi:MAG: 6-phosphofructokinase [Candidatus Margulisiibacteriota bacterium]